MDFPQIWLDLTSLDWNCVTLTQHLLIITEIEKGIHHEVGYSYSEFMQFQIFNRLITKLAITF